MLTIKKDSLKYRDPNTGQFATVGMLETTVYTDGVLPVDPVEIDKTLTVEGAAADAKATGDALNTKLSEDQVREVIDEVLEQAKESGEFDGEPGQGFVILGVYSTEEELNQKVTSPKQGDHYNVGPNAEGEYDLYMYDANKGWINKGSANGGTGASSTTIDFGDDLPQPLGVASAGVSDSATRSDHVHPMPTAKDVGALFVDESETVNGQPTPVNADTLNGVPAAEFVQLKDVIKVGDNAGLIPNIGNNGNWHVGKIDTGIKAQGEVGESAYEQAVRLGLTNLTEEEWLADYINKRDEAIADIEDAGEQVANSVSGVFDQEVASGKTQLATATTNEINNIVSASAIQQTAIENKAQNALNSIPDPFPDVYNRLVKTENDKADFIEMTSARAASHELEAQDAPMHVTLYGATYQSGSGDPSPDNVRPISGVDAALLHAGGKNLLNIGTVTFERRKILDIGKIPPGTYTFSALVTSDDTDSSVCLVQFINEKNNYLAQAYVSRNSRTAKTVTLKDTVDQLYLYASELYSGAAGDTATWSDIQLEIGNTATEYEPYNANVIDMTATLNGEALHGDGTTDDIIENDVPSGCDKTYTFNGTEEFSAFNASSWSKSAVFFASNTLSDIQGGLAPYSDRFAGRVMATSYTQEYIATHNTLTTYMYFSISFERLGIDPTSDTAIAKAAFEAYLATNPLKVYYRSTSYTPDKDLRVCKVTRRYRTIKYSSPVKLNSTGKDGTPIWLGSVTCYDTDRYNGLCDNFVWRAAGWADFVKGNIQTLPNSNTIGFCWDFADADEANAWLADNPIYCTVKLNNPHVYMTDPVELRKPTNVMPVAVTGSGETEVSYAHDTKSYIDSVGDRTSALEDAVSKALPPDTSLSQSGKAADAKAVDERIASVEKDVYESMQRTAESKADAIVDFSEKAASHELYATDAPMHVTLYGKTTETGSGDKSPSNPYVVSGIDSALVHTGSRNLFDITKATVGAGAYNMTITVNGDVVTIKGTPASTNKRSFVILNASQQKKELAGKGYKITPFFVGGQYVHLYGLRTATEAAIAAEIDLVVDEPFESSFRVMISADTPAAYEPYNANVITPALLPDSAPLMGNGAVNDIVENDVLSGCDKCVVFDGSDDEAWFSDAETVRKAFRINGVLPGRNYEKTNSASDAHYLYTNTLPTESQSSANTMGIGASCRGTTYSTDFVVFYPVGVFNDVSAFKSYLSANPLIVYYRSTEYTPDKDLRVCKVTRRWASITLDGSSDEGWKKELSDRTVYTTSISLEKDAIAPTSDTQKLGIVCSAYNEETLSKTYGGALGISIRMARAIRIADPTIATVDDLIAMLAAHPITVVYPVSGRTYMTDPVELRKPVGLVPVTVTGSGETAVEYICNSKHYVDGIENRTTALEDALTSHLTGHVTGEQLKAIEDDVTSLKDTAAVLEDILDVEHKNLVDTFLLASLITNADGNTSGGITSYPDEGYIKCGINLGSHGRRLLSGHKFPVKEGEVYTVSGCVKWDDTIEGRKIAIGIENQYYQMPVSAEDMTEWLRISHTVTINAETAALGEARLVFQPSGSTTMPMYIKDIQVERGNKMTEYAPYGADRVSNVLDDLENRITTTETDTEFLKGSKKFFFYIGNSKTPTIESANDGGLIVTIPDVFCYSFGGTTVSLYQPELLASLGSAAVAYGDDGVQIAMRYQSAIVFNQATRSVEYRVLSNVKDGQILLLCNGYNNPYGPMLNYELRTRVKSLESEFANVQDRYEWEPAAQEYAALFNGTNNVESFLFFTDPHIAEARPIEARFEEYTEFIAKVYDSTPTSYCVCGGDWIGNGDTQTEACYKLGRIDARMRSLINEYVPIVGNHDTNYQGKLDAYSEIYTGTLTDATIRNLLFRREGAAYYRYAGAASAMYVLDSGTDSSATNMTEYRWAQIDWLANALKAETADNVIFAMHIIHNNDNGVIASLADNAMQVAEAYNARTTITLNGTTYDFNGCTGKVRFAIAGHRHTDNVGTLHNIPYVMTTNLEAGSVPTFDLVLADFDAGTAHFVRVGSGESRTVTMA